MKKILFLLAIAAALSAGGFAYIQVKNHAILGNKPQQVTKAKEDQTQTETTAAPAASQDANKPKDDSRLGYDLMNNDSLDFLKYGLPAAEVLAQLGEPETKGAAQEWGADGLVHQTWYYKTKGIELDIVQGDDQQYTVFMITITRPCLYRTKRGIGVGSKKNELLIAYQNEINPEDNSEESVVAGTVYGGIIFTIKNGTVSSIFIGAAAE